MALHDPESTEQVNTSQYAEKISKKIANVSIDKIFLLFNLGKGHSIENWSTEKDSNH